MYYNNYEVIMKKFWKFALATIGIGGVLIGGYQIVKILDNNSQQPTEEQKQENERLKQLLEDKKQKDKNEPPIIIPEDATKDEKEMLQYKQLKKTLENVLNPVHLSRFTNYDHEILNINSINRFNSNYILISADVVWTDGENYTSRKVLYQLHINVKSSIVDNMSMSEIETYIKENQDSIEEYNILEKENETDNEFLSLLFERIKQDNNLSDVTLVNNSVLFPGTGGHSLLFFYEFIDNTTNTRWFYKALVDYKEHRFDKCFELLKSGQPIKYDIDEKHHSDANWLNLDKLNAQNKKEIEENRAKTKAAQEEKSGAEAAAFEGMKEIGQNGELIGFDYNKYREFQDEEDAKEQQAQQNKIVEESKLLFPDFDLSL